MREKCFDEGMIQAFFDGELETAQLESVARHVSDCEPCAFLMSEIEAESASVATAFARENFELVPTERLRTKIFAEIAGYENGGSSWLNKVVAALGFTGGLRWTSPSVAAFASLVLVVGVVAGLLYVRPADNGGPIAQATPKIDKTVPQMQTVTPSTPANLAPLTPATVAAVKPAAEDGFVARKAIYVEPRVARADVQPAAIEVQPVNGEESYLRTIKTLKHSVDVRKQETLRPSALASYERDMAVIDSAIDTMQKTARKNPKDEAAKQILFASYQNKIDLLSSVSDKSDLMVSMR